MRAVVLAAGEGARLRDSIICEHHKGLIKLWSLSLAERVIMALKENGINDIIFVLGFGGEAPKTALGNGERFSVHITYLKNPVWEKGNGTSLYCVKGVLEDEDSFIVSMVDHWYQPEIIANCIKTQNNKKNLLCVDKNLNSINDIDDATKVCLDQEKRIIAIGKELKEYNALDCGVFLLTPDVFYALEKSFKNGNFSLTGGIKALVNQSEMWACEIGDKLWQDIDTEDDFSTLILIFLLFRQENLFNRECGLSTLGQLGKNSRPAFATQKMDWYPNTLTGVFPSFYLLSWRNLRLHQTISRYFPFSLL